MISPSFQIFSADGGLHPAMGIVGFLGPAILTDLPAGEESKFLRETSSKKRMPKRCHQSPASIPSDFSVAGISNRTPSRGSH